ncbi:MAG: NifX-associated nitrogen fixation protein [Magnetococcales bacterium]|nr:NifX-associated nitrogen fixation protein [Magnetococcales bacterium]
MIRTIAADNPILGSEFIRELVRQLRALDTYGAQNRQTPEALLEPFITPREGDGASPLPTDSRPAALARLGAFYNAVAMMIEKECGLTARPFFNVDPDGQGHVLVIVGKLVVVDKVLRGANRFGFHSISQLKDESDKLLAIALGRIGTYSEVAGL